MSKRILSIFSVLAVTFLSDPLIGYAHNNFMIPSDAVEYNGHFYKVYNSSMTWSDAKSTCAKMGGYLATVTSADEEKFVYDLLKNGTKNYYWLGASDDRQEGVWEWITGEAWNYTHWISGQPNNHNDQTGTSENYLAIARAVRGWNDLPDTGDRYGSSALENSGYICEWDEPTVGSFIDVHESDYFAPYVVWAVDNGATNGTSPNTFSPHDTCTVAQILTFLWRAEGSSNPGIVNPFSDIKESDYFYSSALWAYKNGLVFGSAFNGNTPCTRANAVTYLWKLAGKPIYNKNPFKDVPSDADYAQAVAWAVNQGVTSGTSTTTFSPNQICTRAQIVTFLYRFVSLNLPELQENEVNAYAGPGDNYQYVGKIEESEIRECIREENNWIEVEYQNRRAYVRESSLTNLETASLPYVASSPVVGPTQRPYVVFFSGIERK